MNSRQAQFPLLLGGLVIAACGDRSDPAQIAQPNFTQDDAAQVLTIDHQVPHISTVPANAGEMIHLFVRERVRSDTDERRKAVLMIHGASVPALPAFELGLKSYDWAGWLAKSGFDVFMLDHQGSGRSPRPRMDDPCNTNPAQQSLLIPNPLSATCPVSYPFQLINAQSDWDELDVVVDYIMAQRNVEKVALVAWSQGSFRVGPYAIQHPDKVESILFFAPVFNPNGRASRPGTRFDPAVALPVSAPAAQFGFPMTLTSKAAFSNAWDIEQQCPGQRDEGILDVAWNSIMENDALGSGWGRILPGGSEGVMRIRNPFLWGWNNTTVALDGTLGGPVPVLIIHGEHDRQINAPPFSVTALYEGIPGPSKMLFKVACSSHYMNWEKQAKVLHHISKQWLKHGAVDGRTNGIFFVDTEGVITP